MRQFFSVEKNQLVNFRDFFGLHPLVSHKAGFTICQTIILLLVTRWQRIVVMILGTCYDHKLSVVHWLQLQPTNWIVVMHDVVMIDAK